MGKQEVFCRDGLRPKSHASLLYSIQKTVCEASSMSKFIVLNTIQKTYCFRLNSVVVIYPMMPQEKIL